MIELSVKGYYRQSSVLLVILLAGTCLVFAGGCTRDSSPSPTDNPRIAARNLSLPAVGTVTQLPLVKDVAVVQSGAPGPQKNIFLLVVTDSAPLAYDSTGKLEFYGSATDETPVYSFTVAELKAMVNSTHCSPSVAKYVEGAKAGEFLFCGGALDLSHVHYFVFKESENDKDFATSYTLDFVDKANDVVAITLAIN